jgi:hypothetical protein
VSAQAADSLRRSDCVHSGSAELRVDRAEVRAERDEANMQAASAEEFERSVRRLR